jgi:hypothetical protein
MKNLAITTLTIVTLTIFAGDARAQGSFFGNLFGLNTRRPVSNSSYYGTTYPVSTYPAANYPATNCSNGTCTTTQYAPTWNNSGYYSNSGGSSYHNTYPSHYGSTSAGYGNWNTPQSVVPASYSNCPGGCCPQTPTARPTTPYNTTPYAPGHYNAPAYNTPAYNTPAYNTPSYNAPYYNSY